MFDKFFREIVTMRILRIIFFHVNIWRSFTWSTFAAKDYKRIVKKYTVSKKINKIWTNNFCFLNFKITPPPFISFSLFEKQEKEKRNDITKMIILQNWATTKHEKSNEIKARTKTFNRCNKISPRAHPTLSTNIHPPSQNKHAKIHAKRNDPKKKKKKEKRKRKKNSYLLKIKIHNLQLDRFHGHDDGEPDKVLCPEIPPSVKHA